MGIEVMLSILSGVASLLAGGLGTSDFVRRIVDRFLQQRPRGRLADADAYSERLARLTHELTRSSYEVDKTIAELAQVARDRETAVRKLETDLAALSDREKRLKERIEALEHVPIPVAEHFVALTASGEKRSARRDYLLFGAGVVVSTVTSIIFFLLGGS